MSDPSPEGGHQSLGAGHDPHHRVAAGWFPAGNGIVRYWDGANWTEHVAPDPNSSMGRTNDDNTMAILCHAGGAFFSVLVPLIIFLVKRDESPYVRHHALEALNFHVTVFLASIVAGVLILVVIGIFLLLGIIVAFYVLSIVASIAASRGEWYQYPMSLRLFT
ncbi:MAG: DUF4870 domain-containing protein [Actinomycetia bacterium]|nr:DUF4870 domain-containing protein [Actinomycetes bacterium]